MCFCAEASLAASAVLIPAGGYCLTTAWQKAPRLWPLAAVPVLFGIQQFAEGLVWIGLERQDDALIAWGARAFLFFALALWPFWFVFAGAVLETRPNRRRFLMLATIAASGWLWFVYLPVALADHGGLTVQVVRHSIFYDYYRTGVFQVVSPTVVRLLYLASVVLPLLVVRLPQVGEPAKGSAGTSPRVGAARNWSESVRRWRWGIGIAASAAVAAWMFDYAFISVWCFFAAILSGFLVSEFHRLRAGRGASALQVPRRPKLAH
jgi:hypothetical protein